MANITEHNPNEESKSNNVERRRIDFVIGRDSIGVDDGLWDLQHDIGIKFTGRHLFTLYYIENKGRDTNFGLDGEGQFFGGDVKVKPDEILGDLCG